MSSSGLIDVVLPIFALIGIGYLTSRLNLLSQDIGDALGQFVYTIAIPVLIFRTLVTADFGNASPWALWATYFTGALIAWTCGTLVIRKIFRREARAGVIGGISAAFANTVLVGIPLVGPVYGEEGLGVLFILLAVHLPVMTIVCTFVMERASVVDGYSDPRALRELLWAVCKNLGTSPLVIGIVSGALYSLADFPYGGLPSDIIDKLAATAVPIALFSLGMSLRNYGVRGNISAGLILSVIKLALMPAFVFITGKYVFGLPPMWVAVATVTAGCPTGVNAYIFANRYGTGYAISANTITFTTAAAVVTTTIILKLLGVP
ncbi:MAG: AEC family transporter [Stappiaceae bacterium]